MGTDLPCATAPVGARRSRRIVFVIIGAASFRYICARDLRAGRELSRATEQLSNRIGINVESESRRVADPRRLAADRRHREHRHTTGGARRGDQGEDIFAIVSQDR